MNRRVSCSFSSPSSPGLAASILLLASGALYAYTLAPTLLWGDDAMFQQSLAVGALTNHPLWGVLARLFARVPKGDPAFRANLASAVYAVGAVGFLFLATLALIGTPYPLFGGGGLRLRRDHGVRAALAAGAVLAVSHTFWLEAVRAEVYTLHMLLFLGGLWAFLRWRQAPYPAEAGRDARRILWLLLGILFWGVGTVNHLLLTMALPGGLWLILSALSPVARKRVLVFSPLAALIAVLLLSFLEPAFLTKVVPGAARVVLATFNLSLSRLAMHLTILVYQFPMFGLLAIPGFVHLWRHDRGAAVSLCLMAVPTAAFASTHSILESYVFYMPVFGLIALCVGVGFGLVTRPRYSVPPLRGRYSVPSLRGRYSVPPLRGRYSVPPLRGRYSVPPLRGRYSVPPLRGWIGRRWLVVGLALLALQIGLYRVTPMLVDRFVPGIIPSRDLPGRRASTFFLWPPKHGYLGARQFAEGTLDLLPADAMLIADWTIFTPLQYLQDVEGRRQDVLVVQVDPLGMQAIRENNGRRPLFLANADPRYYPMGEFNERFQLQPVGQIFALQRTQDGVPALQLRERGP